MDKKLYWVNLDIGINATNDQDAMNKVHKILAGGIEMDYNYLVHKAEKEFDNIILEQLRKEQDKKKKEEE